MLENPTFRVELNNHSPPIVGRSAERTLLHEQLCGSTSDHGQSCIRSGGAGIGKTALVRELISEARRNDMDVLVGQCYDLTTPPPYGLWLDLANDYAARSDTGM